MDFYPKTSPRLSLNDNVAALAKDLLANPQTKIACVGPRRHWLRAVITLFVLPVAIGATISKAIVLPVFERSGLLHEAAARKVDASHISSAPVDIKWVELPRSVFLEAGRLPDGRVSLNLMASQWQAAGVPSGEAISIINEMPKLSPVVLGRSDPVLEKQLQDEAIQADMRLRGLFPDAFAKLEESQASSQQVAFENYSFQDRIVFNRTIGLLQAEPTPLTVSLGNVDMATAMGFLEEAVDEAGLRSLRLPLGAWEDPQQVISTAYALRAANKDLSKVTGWTGTVLGLDGRVELTLGAPLTNSSSSGITAADFSGRLQVVSSWSALGHEWFHALDAVSARLMMKYSDGNYASESLYPLRAASNRDAYEGWDHVTGVVLLKSQDWHQHRKEASKTNDYWLSRKEGMAFAFSAYLSQNASVLRDNYLLVRDGYPHRLPSEVEVATHAKAWPVLFQKLAPLGLSGPSKVEITETSRRPSSSEDRFPTLF